MKRALSILILLSSASVAIAAGSQRRVLGAEDFAAGELKHLVLDADGALHLSPLSASVRPLDAFYAWSIARDAKGRLVVGSGDGGAIFRERGDALELWAQTLALEILCLLPDGDRVLAGSSPDGIVYAISGDGAVEVALDLPQQSIWDLAPAADGFFAASGPGAKVVRVGDGAAAGETWAELPATNAMRLCVQDGDLWIGTESPALVFHAANQDATSMRALFEAPEQEIRQIVPAGDGAVYVLSLDLLSGTGKGARSRITWLSESGENETIHVGEERLLALALDADGSLIAADAEARQLLRIERDRKVVLHAAEQGDPISLFVDADGALLVGTGNLASLIELRPQRAESGQFDSDVLAIEQVARWGSVDAWPPSRKLRFRARSGVRAEPDDSWSDWSAPQALGDRPDVPVAPYIQLRVEFESDAPALGNLHLNYRERNLAPRVRELRVLAADAPMMRGSSGSSPGPVSQVLEDGLSVEFSVQSKQQQAEPDQAAWARGVRAIAWTSSDANDDRLTHTIELASWPGEQWSTLAEDVESAPFAWDTRAWPDGSYRVRVRASDARDNVLGEAREAEAISAIVQVDNGAPEIEGLRYEEGRLRAQLRDASSPLAAIAWRDDARGWQELDVVDGVLDGRSEALDLRLPPASGRIRIRLVDAAGNVRLAELPAP